MIKLKIRLLFILLFYIPALFATTVTVRILTVNVVSSFVFSPLNGTYVIYGDDKKITDCDASGIYEIGISNDSVMLKSFEKVIGTYGSLKMLTSQSDGSFNIKSVIPQSKIRMYDDNLTVGLTPDKKQFLLINKVELEKYIAGVVETEAGTKADVEYYKLQSILCRTYLLAHITRHIVEGFEVCDAVHCQAYHNKASKTDISEGVYNTMGEVVVDGDLNLITAAFHSNCGGETCNSQDVWAVPTTYLKSVKDTFCLRQPHARWQRSISLEDWRNYLQVKQNNPLDDSSELTTPTSFDQSTQRAIYFISKNLKIPLKTIRADFQLKSTFFSIQQKGDMVIFNGRGYGHGVGLCQEGAMRMAKLNYSYRQILNFYYKDVYLVNLTALSYFKQE